MSTDTIEKGSKVEVSLTADYSHKGLSGRHILTADDGTEINVPKDAALYVMQKPIAPEPRVSTVVESKWDGRFYQRSYAGWYALSDQSRPITNFQTWKDLNASQMRNLVVLVRDPFAKAVDLTTEPVTVEQCGYPYKTIKFGCNAYGEITLSVNGHETGVSHTQIRKAAKAILAKVGV